MATEFPAGGNKTKVRRTTCMANLRSRAASGGSRTRKFNSGRMVVPFVTGCQQISDSITSRLGYVAASTFRLANRKLQRVHLNRKKKRHKVTM